MSFGTSSIFKSQTLQLSIKTFIRSACIWHLYAKTLNLSVEFVKFLNTFCANSEPFSGIVELETF